MERNSSPYKGQENREIIISRASGDGDHLVLTAATAGYKLTNHLSPAASAADNLQPNRRSKGATSVVTRDPIEGRSAKGKVPGWHAGVRQCQLAAQSLLSTQLLTQPSTKEASTGEATPTRVRDSKPAGLIDKHGCRQDQPSPATNVPSNGFGVRPEYLLGPLIGAKPTHGTHV